MKAIGYPLSVSRLTKSQLHTLQGSMVSIMLNRMHFSRRTARVLVYGPRYYGGLEFGTFQTAQGAGKIILLLRHLRTPGQPHDLLLIDRFQYTAGVGFNVMENNKMVLPHLEGVWLPTAREYLGQISAHFKSQDSKYSHLNATGTNILWISSCLYPDFWPMIQKW
jgi:hypothetical protein